MIRKAASHTFKSLIYSILATSALFAAGTVNAGVITPEFSKAFVPDTIGPGSTSMLVFAIDNSAGSEPLDMLAFSDTLPSGMVLAAPAFVSNDCGGIVTAPDGGDTISLSDGGLGDGATCTIIVNVTAPLPEEGTYNNTSGTLTCDNDCGGIATADLTVDSGRPGFSKSFAPSTVAFGGRSTLTFTIDNSLNTAAVTSFLTFTDILPTGMVVADPANASTDCNNPVVGPATLTAVPGTSVIAVSALGTGGFPILAVGGTCTVTVDVIGGAVGLLGNVSGELIVDVGVQDDLSAGKAAAVLEVTGVEDLLELSKEFTDDPAAPGGTVILEFTVTNKSRDDAATGITFSDDLGTTLTGLAPSGPLPADPCGAGSSLGFGPGVLTLTGGTLPPEGSCTFSVELSVPGATTPGTYSNTAGPVSGDVGGEPETGNSASDLLFVVGFPLLTKDFTDDVVAAGDSVTLEFTITNTNPDSAMSAITFIDELTDGSSGLPPDLTSGFLPFPVSVTLPPVPSPPCGPGSFLALTIIENDRQGLELTGGSLDEAGGTVDSCTFSVMVDIPVGLESGLYTNTTEEIFATLDDIAMTPTVTGPPASDDLEVTAAPDLSKEFIDDPVIPGGTVTVEFTLRYTESAGSDATAIAFADDLTFVTDLMATGVGPSTCDGTVDISTPTLIGYAGGTMSPGEECAFTVTLLVPPAAPVGFHLNTTSDVTATVGLLTGVPNNGGEDDLLITPVVFTKDFTDDPVIPGDTVDLEFRLENLSSTLTVSSIAFTDVLSAILPGTPDVTVVLPLPTLPASCGASASLTDITSTILLFASGEIAPLAVCSFTVTLLVPTGVVDDEYANLTSGLTTSLGTLPAATDDLIVNSNLLALTKEFTDDPVNPGDNVTLKFTLENLSGSKTVTDIAFDDDLDAALSGLMATSASMNDCGGMGDGFPAGLFEYSGGTLLPGESCTIVLAVDVPDAPLSSGPPYINTTSSVTGKVDALVVFGDAASDELELRLVSFSKSFDGPTTATGTAVLTFTIENLDSVNPVTGLAFSDDLNAVLSGLEATLPPTPDPPCGAGSALAGTSFLTLNGASLAPAGSPGDTCSFAVTVTVPPTASAGSFPNTTSDLFQFGLPVADPATALLVIEPAPVFTKSFAPDMILPGEVSTLTFTIDNSASTLEASGLDFTDMLPAGVVVATPSAKTKTCPGGMVDATEGGGTIGYAGGSVGAGVTCTLQVDVTAAAGVHVNTTGDLTSSSGNSGPASDTLTADVDTDGDGLFNLVDPDDDNDGLEDGLDPDPLDPDTDGDQIIDGLDPEPTFFQNICIGFGTPTDVILENLTVPAGQIITCAVPSSITVEPTAQFEQPGTGGRLVLISLRIIFKNNFVVPFDNRLNAISADPTALIPPAEP